jgi:hypothetical protein
MMIRSTKEKFLDPADTDMHGIGSSGTAQRPQGSNAGPRIAVRTQLFRSPPSTPLGGSHDTHTEEATTQIGSKGGDGDEADDLTNYMVAFPKARRVTNTRTLKGTFMVNEEELPLKQVKVPGNNNFYRSLENKALLISGSTIRERWNSQNSNLKKELMDYLESLFGVDTFNKTLATAATDQYLKYTRETYRKHLKQNDRYDRPLMILEREWKALIEDAKEKKLTDEGKTPPGPIRLIDTSKATKARLAKCGKHKLGQGGYLKL